MCVPKCTTPAHRTATAPAYHGSDAPSRASQGARFALAVLLGLGLAACSTTMQLEGLFSDKTATAIADRGDAGDITGSLPERPVGTSAHVMSSSDWTFATTALREALARQDDVPSIPWSNPESGARGTVTPVASAYVQDGSTCRNFLASSVWNAKEGWFEGVACRDRGRWDVRSTRPLQKS